MFNIFIIVKVDILFRDIFSWKRFYVIMYYDKKYFLLGWFIGEIMIEKKLFYIIILIYYLLGKLYIGFVYIMIVCDVLVCYKCMMGFDV